MKTKLKRIALAASLLLLAAVVALFIFGDTNPDEQPEISALTGTWIPTTHKTRPPAQYLRLNADHTFVATNFPVSPAFGQSANVSGTGEWELSPSYAAFLVKFSAGNAEHAFRVVGRHSPFVLADSIYDDDESLKARRLEDSK